MGCPDYTLPYRWIMTNAYLVFGRSYRLNVHVIVPIIVSIISVEINVSADNTFQADAKAAVRTSERTIQVRVGC